MDKVNKTREVKKYLETHKRGVTSIQAFEKWQATRLSAIIFNLRHTYHMDIVTVDEKTKDGTTYARYVLRRKESA